MTSKVTTNLPAGSRSTGQSSTDDQTPSNQSIYIGLGVAFAVVAVTAVAIGIALYIRRNTKRCVCLHFEIKTHKLHTNAQDNKFIFIVDSVRK